jgi:type I restriction enzyme S subunit
MTKRSSHNKASRNGATRDNTAWPSVRIDSVGEVQGGRQRSEKIVKGNPRKYLRVANVFDGFIDYSTAYQMLFTEAEERIYELIPGDILLNEGQSLDLVGRSAIYEGLPREYCFQNTLIRFRPSSQIYSAFAQQVFQFYLTTGVFAAIAARTTSIAHLGVERFASLCIPVPPLPEQHAIASLLSVWDQAICKTSALIAAKQRLKQGLMQQLLSGTKRFRGSKSNWITCHIGDLLTEVRRYVSVDDDTSYRLVSVRRNSGGMFDREPRPGRDIGYSKLMTVETGDFLIARRQVIHGAMTIVRKRFHGAYVSDAYAILVPKPGVQLHMSYLNMLSQAPRMYYSAFRCSYGVAIEKMVFHLEWFLREQVCIPPTVEEQRRIADVFAELDREIHQLERRRAALQKQKRGLMQKLLTGQARVSEALLKKGAKA